MDHRPATIKDVASRAGVSASTVSNVLLGQKKVRQASHDQVMRAVAELGYTVDPAASHLRTGRSRIVGMVVPSLENPFFTAMVAAVERLCQRDGYELVVASSAEDAGIEAARVRALLTWRPAGFIILPFAPQLAMRSRLEAAGVPFVVADRAVQGEACDFVEIDNEEAGRLAAEHLASLGHRRIAVCAPALDVLNIQERIRGVAGVLATLGAPAPEQIATGRGMPTDGSELALDQVLSRVTAVIALTNTATLQVLAALARTRRSVLADVSLVGFDDYAWMAVAQPSITAVRQPVAAMGESIWATLRDRIKGVEGEARHRKHAAELVVRGSTARCPGHALIEQGK